MEDGEKIDRLKDQFPLYSEDLGIDLQEPEGRFRWFLASILFGARIGERIAANTYMAFQRAGLDSPEKILAAGWDELVRILDEGGYVRYDFSTATKLLRIMRDLKERYGSLEELRRRSADTKDLERRLKEFKGIGPVTAQIFLRELRAPWKVNPAMSSRAREMAACLGLDIIDLERLERDELARVETALVKLSLRYCKRKRCSECAAVEYCRNKREIKTQRATAGTTKARRHKGLTKD
jgi:endonuclease III